MTDLHRRRQALADRRRSCGFTHESLAERIGSSPDSVSAWERGARCPGPWFRGPLADALDMSLAELDHLLDPDSRALLPSVEVAPWLSVYESLAAGADGLVQCEQNVIPALLQSRAYASAIERHGPLRLTDTQIAGRVDARMRRQAPLQRTADALRFRCLLSETVLRRQVGDSGVMREQLGRLLDLGRLPNIEIHLVPADEKSVYPSGFQLLSRGREAGPFLVVTFDVAEPRYHERPEVVQIFTNTANYLHSIALSVEDTRDRIYETMRNTR